MAVQQLLGREAFLIAASARTPTAELVPGLEGPPLFHHRNSTPRSARRHVHGDAPSSPNAGRRTKTNRLRGFLQRLRATFCGDLREAPAVAVQMRLLPAHGFPPG